MSICQNCGRTTPTKTVMYYTAKMISEDRMPINANQTRVTTTYGGFSLHTCAICARCQWRSRTMGLITTLSAIALMIAEIILTIMGKLSLLAGGILFAISFIAMIALGLYYDRPFKPQREALAACKAADKSSKWLIMSPERFNALYQPGPRGW